MLVELDKQLIKMIFQTPIWVVHVINRDFSSFWCQYRTDITELLRGCRPQPWGDFGPLSIPIGNLRPIFWIKICQRGFFFAQLLLLRRVTINGLFDSSKVAQMVEQMKQKVPSLNPTPDFMGLQNTASITFSNLILHVLRHERD